MAASTRHLSTSAERREALIEAAVTTFAERGFHGTPTTAVARAAGISQAYLFRLFPTKEELYVAAIDRCHDKLAAAFERGAERARAEGLSPLDGMGLAYVELVQDRTVLRATLHAFAAAAGDDAAVRDAVRAGYARLYGLVGRLGGGGAEELRAFFAQGMLLTILTGVDAPGLDEPWARALLGGDDADCAVAIAASQAGAPAGPAEA